MIKSTLIQFSESTNISMNHIMHMSHGKILDSNIHPITSIITFLCHHEGYTWFIMWVDYDKYQHKLSEMCFIQINDYFEKIDLFTLHSFGLKDCVLFCVKREIYCDPDETDYFECSEYTIQHTMIQDVYTLSDIAFRDFGKPVRNKNGETIGIIIGKRYNNQKAGVMINHKIMILIQHLQQQMNEDLTCPKDEMLNPFSEKDMTTTSVHPFLFVGHYDSGLLKCTRDDVSNYLKKRKYNATL